MANAIYQQQHRIIEQLDQPYFCSNDNGFLGQTWKQRTQMVLLKNGDRFALIKKPAHTVFTALAKLGNVRLGVDGLPDVRSGLGVLATRNAQGQVAILAFNDGRADTQLTLMLKDLPKREWMLSHLRIDANSSNPIRIWGKGDIPPRDVLPRLREEMELSYAGRPKKITSAAGPLQLNVQLAKYSVSLLLLTAKPSEQPKAVKHIRVDKFPGLFGPEHLLTWAGSGDYALRTYEILHSREKNGKYQRLNKADLLCNAYMGPAAENGFYRIRAVNVWGMSTLSDPVAIGGEPAAD